jgi:uncharacterized protein with NRDE domain
MCTLIALHRVHAVYPLVVAANRDELYARRSTGPTLLRDAPRVVGGRDEEKGGTWLGVSQHGFFVGLTNQRSFTPPDPALRSRGEVVLAALAEPGVVAAVGFLNALDGRQFNGFNLLVGDANALFVAYARPDQARLEIHALAPGIWALPNDRLHSPDFPKADRAVELARPLAGLPWPELVPAAQAVLGDHVVPPMPPAPKERLPAWLSLDDLPRLQALCVHTPAYGTRTAALFAFSERGLEQYFSAEGPPCQTALTAHPELVSALAG